MVTGGVEILKAQVACMYPEDDSFPNEDIKEVSSLPCIVDMHSLKVATNLY